MPAVLGDAIARRRLAALGLVLALLTGCGGSRIDHAAVVAAGNGYEPGAAQAETQGAAAAAPSGSPAVVAAPAGAGVAARTVAVPGVPTPAARSGARPGAVAGTKAVTAGTASAAQQPAAIAVDASCPQQLAPVVLGQTLASSGLVGAAIGGLRGGLAVWTKDINARGGLACHPVRLIQLDDASDPARVSANWNSIVHDRGAVAVVGAGAPIAIAALRTAAERDKVPVVGGDITAEDWVQSPYLFPTGGAPLTSYDGGVIEATKQTPGTRKAGLLYCVEASICTGLKNNYPKSVERAGAEPGPIQAVSLIQSDYTFECQKMKEAGVTTLFLGLDGSASVRAVRSCASLNYFPAISMGAIGLSAAASVDPGLRRNRTFLGSGLVPYTTTDTAGIQAFHAATARYAPSAPEDQQTLLGWAAGKLLEAAVAKVAAQARAGTITTAMVLDGLWQLTNEKLQGLSPGATFTKGSPAKAVDCYYGLRLDEKGFAAVDGSRPVCFGPDRKLAHP
ncbi:MAG TPA: ABC transporter substrate-binding protein [Sporichthyaceae bacterium]|jgi:branched-chain amino acid transport system substrate-binding protein|nr:ABC transporter substrate-binding protein [Sporichthyaceae bacterium]